MLLKGTKLSYLRALAFILRSTGLTSERIAKKWDKSELWTVLWSSTNESCEDQKRTRIPNIYIPLNEVAKKFWVMLSTNWNSIYPVEICLHLTELFAQQTDFKTLLTCMEV